MARMYEQHTANTNKHENKQLQTQKLTMAIKDYKLNKSITKKKANEEIEEVWEGQRERGNSREGRKAVFMQYIH